jgi:hypothetical protein
MILRKLTVFVILLSFLTGCGDDPTKPYLKFIGGGFVNYVTNNIVTYSFVVKRVKTLPTGSVLEASFDLPNTDRKFVTWLPSDPNRDKYIFESEPLLGLQKGNPLKVKLRLLDAVHGKEIAVFEKIFQSDSDQIAQ